MHTTDSSEPIRFITRKWPPAVGGMETYSAKLADELGKRGVVDVIALPGRASGAAPTALALVGFGLNTAVKLLGAREARVVHVADLASWPLAWIAGARHPRSRIILSAHGSDVTFAQRSGWRAKLYGAYLRLGSAALPRARVIANSNYIGGLVRRVGFGRVSVVPLATDMTYAGTAERRHLLYAGRISRPKGLRFLVEEVLPLLPSAVRLRVAGAVWEESERPLLSNSRIDYLGVLPPQALARELARAIAVLVPTRDFEGFGLVAIEAAACGAWVIASDHSGLADVAREPVGIAVDAQDAKVWAAAIDAALARTDEQLETDAHAAQAEVERCYRWPRVVDATLAIYNR